MNEKPFKIELDAFELAQVLLGLRLRAAELLKDDRNSIYNIEAVLNLIKYLEAKCKI